MEKRNIHWVVGGFLECLVACKMSMYFVAYLLTLTKSGYRIRKSLFTRHFPVKSTAKTVKRQYDKPILRDTSRIPTAKCACHTEKCTTAGLDGFAAK